MAMTQTAKPIGAQVGPLLYARATGTIPATGTTTLLEVPTLGLKNIAVAFDVGVNDIDAFVVSAQFHPEDTFHSLYSAITSTPAGLILAGSGTLAAQGAGTTGWLIMDVRGIYKVRFGASGTVADTATIAINCCGSR